MRSLNLLPERFICDRAEYERGKRTPNTLVAQKAINLARFGFTCDKPAAVELRAQYVSVGMRRGGAEDVLLSMHHPEDMDPIEGLQNIEGRVENGIWRPATTDVLADHPAFAGLKHTEGYFVAEPQEEPYAEHAIPHPALFEFGRMNDQIEEFLAQVSVGGLARR